MAGWLWERGAQLNYSRLFLEPDLPEVADLDLVIAMGGPMSVNDDLPWIPGALALIRRAVAEGVPVIGHCLGGQLMSKALGGYGGFISGSRSVTGMIREKSATYQASTALPPPIAAAGIASLAIIRQNPGLKLVVEQSHEGWSTDKAMATTENALTKYKNQVDAFICNNSGMARGVVAALDAQGLANSDKVFVAGSDADLANIQYVAQGKQTVEIWKKVKPLAETAAEIAVKLAQNPDKKPADIIKVDKTVNNGAVEVPTVVTEIVSITKDNLDSTVIAGGLYTKEQVYGKK